MEKVNGKMEKANGKTTSGRMFFRAVAVLATGSLLALAAQSAYAASKPRSIPVPERQCTKHSGCKWIMRGAGTYTDFTTHATAERAANFCRQSGGKNKQHMKDRFSGAIDYHDAKDPNFSWATVTLTFECKPQHYDYTVPNFVVKQKFW